MARPCSICTHARRAEIDAALTGGASLRDVAAQFGLPSRTSLHRHRTEHLGREVTFHIPPSASAHAVASVATHIEGAPGAPVPPENVLDHLFARASANAETRSLQDYARLTFDGLAHVYASAVASGDHGVAVRALRELRAMTQFHAIVSPQKLHEHPGWRQPPEARDPVFALERLLLAQTTGCAAEEAAARAELGASAWPADPIH